MSEILNTVGLGLDEPVAVPCLRVAVVLDGTLSVAANHAALSSVYDIFMARFGSDLKFHSILKSPANVAKATKITPTKLAAVRDAVSTGLHGLYNLRLFGTDANPLGVPFLPYFNVLHHPAYPMTVIEMMIPADLADGVAILDQTDAALRCSPVRFGYQGLGFGKTDMRYDSEWVLPPAYRRFRTAIMGRFESAPQFLWFRQNNIVLTKGDYSPGLTDTGWRTYVGAAFRDRLGDPASALAAGVTLEALSHMTVVTAGPSPIWGDATKGQDTGVYQAAHAYVRPAYAERKWMVNFAPWSSRDAEMTSQSEGYIDRLLP